MLRDVCRASNMSRHDTETRRNGNIIGKGRTPVEAPVPDALSGTDVYIRDARRGALLVRVAESVRSKDELVVRPNGRLVIMNENDVRHASLPLRTTITFDRLKGGWMHVLPG